MRDLTRIRAGYTFLVAGPFATTIGGANGMVRQALPVRSALWELG